MLQDRSLDPEDERLRRLGAQWFAEVRGRNPEPEPPRRRDTGGGAGGDDGGLFDWLFGGDADDAGDSGGDGGD